MKTLKFVIESNASYTIRTAMYEGREHIIVPVVMMVEGVHNGSRGPVFHSAEELGHIPQAFNGIPVVINHPQDENNDFVSANSPSIIEEIGVGKIFNTRFQDNKLRGEAWLDVQRLAAVSPEALQYIRNSQPLEVSLGMFNDEDQTEGDWNGEHYEAIAYNHRPDHLALLPGGVGACSWTDGCGIRVNKKGGNDVSEATKKTAKTVTETLQVMKEFSNEGFYLQEIVCHVERGYKELVINTQAKLDRMDDDMKVHFLQEIFDDYMVYEVRRRENTSQGNGIELYRRDYSIGTNGEIEFTSDPVRVQRNVEYVVQKGLKRTKFNSNKNNENMSKTHDCVDCEKKIQALIVNEDTRFTDDDREWLTTLGEDQLDKLAPPEKKPEVVDEGKEKKAEPEVNKKKGDDGEDGKKSVMELLTAEQKAALAYGEKQMKARQAELIQSIQANTEKVWTDEELNAMDLEVLEKVAESVKPVSDYSAAGGATITDNVGEDNLYPAGIEVGKEDK